eukprot:TRINITY_DN10531_c0_g1_i1.p1 TRINITY_DN10531_c0_g1~~TRINITY_DN10531_c0_g1_i1.p1  ORF type:complete len:444 (+),score=79.86 TRINITY_DN10531_c0_g1_i1:175-1506(+)
MKIQILLRIPKRRVCNRIFSNILQQIQFQTKNPPLQTLPKTTNTNQELWQKRNEVNQEQLHYQTSTQQELNAVPINPSPLNSYATNYYQKIVKSKKQSQGNNNQISQLNNYNSFKDFSQQIKNLEMFSPHVVSQYSSNPNQHKLFQLYQQQQQQQQQFNAHKLSNEQNLENKQNQNNPKAKGQPQDRSEFQQEQKTSQDEQQPQQNEKNHNNELPKQQSNQQQQQNTQTQQSHNQSKEIIIEEIETSLNSKQASSQPPFQQSLDEIERLQKEKNNQENNFESGLKNLFYFISKEKVLIQQQISDLQNQLQEQSGKYENLKNQFDNYQLQTTQRELVQIQNSEQIQQDVCNSDTYYKMKQILNQMNIDSKIILPESQSDNSQTTRRDQLNTNEILKISNEETIMMQKLLIKRLVLKLDEHRKFNSLLMQRLQLQGQSPQKKLLQ